MSAAREVRVRPVVVVACARDDIAALTPVVRGLVARQLRVDLVPLQDANVMPLEAALEQFGASATYVVCHTAAIDRYTTDLCELTVRAAEVPETHLVSAWFDPSDPDAFVTTIWTRALAGSSDEVVVSPRPVALPARPAPRVVVHSDSGAVVQARPVHEDSAASTRVAMRMALGWRRALHPMTYVLVALVLIVGGLYFLGSFGHG